MKEFRPQQMASRPIFMIAFTFMAVIYGIWMGYEYVILDLPVNWYSLFFILAVVGLLWYSRMTGSFFIRVYEDRLEWRVRRNELHILGVDDVTTIGINHLSIDFMTAHGMKELSLANFDRGEVKERVVQAIKAWGDKNDIHIEE